MTLWGKTFAARRPKLLAALALALAAFSAVAHEHRIHDETGQANCAEVATNDYLAWHQQQAASVEVDTLSGSLRLFSSIADQLAADASEGDGYTAVVAHDASPQHAAQR